MAHTYRALVLQGGGALGAFEMGAVKALYEQPWFRPDVVTGVSIGAISAAVLTGAKAGPVAGLGLLWERLAIPEIPFLPGPLQLLFAMPRNPGMYRINPEYMWSPTGATSICTTAPLYSTLADLIDLDVLNSPKSPELVVTATNIQTGLIEEFSTRKQRLGFEHIVASGSLPPSFPMTEIDGQHYWDGGLFSNTPLHGAFKSLEKLGTDEDRREIYLVELFPREGLVPTNMSQVSNRMSQMAFESKIRNEMDHYIRWNDTIDMVNAIAADLPKDSAVRKTPLFKSFLKARKIDAVHVIRHSEPELLTGGADFTQQTIQRRIAQGYSDTMSQLAA
ncbi:MAG: patatin-like phospholipase family protein [Limnobacter sp.]|nr:patatin-like phospholipase family protein [Limnobacter sp.]